MWNSDTTRAISARTTSNSQNGSRSSQEPPVWVLWGVMFKMFGQRWNVKNGNRPSELWEAQVNSMTSEHLTRVCGAITERWKAGNHWPPDFAEFMVLVAECTGGVLGLTVDDVLEENKRWRNEFYRYSSTEAFPWKHPVLYQICIVLKRKGIDFKLTEKELRDLAGKELAYWEKRAESGLPPPPIRRQLAAPKAPPGPTPAELAYAEYKRKKNLG